MSNKTLKVTDRRMFTPEGDLREEFRNLSEEPEEDRPGAPAAAPPVDARPTEDRPTEDGPTEHRRPGAPSFFDLVGLLAEPASIYLREARSAPPQAAAQSLELARLHIDLLAILQDKTEGNLTPEEKAMLEDVVYQLRSGFAGLRG